ncbi:MAG: WYL domain-containing protein [Candidatus Omnitrophica bacterium]|nr:WYL domain-containing protein [Candidatus Omnitrophota bacterium]
MPDKTEKIVLDLETKKGFQEVGRNNLGLLGISVAGFYSYKEDAYRVIPEADIAQLKPYLQQAELVIGFNLKRFDYPVLQPYMEFDVTQLNTLDMFEEVYNKLGFRLSLDSIAKATLQVGKTGSGLDALKFFQQGEMKKLAEYCRQDVYITKEVYEYGLKHGHLLYHNKLALETIPISWGESKNIKEILLDAFSEHKTIEIEYSASMANSGKRQPRKIDIYGFDLGRVIAFCHLRNNMRTFNIRRILSAKVTDKTYNIPAAFDLQAFIAKQKF